MHGFLAVCFLRLVQQITSCHVLTCKLLRGTLDLPLIFLLCIFRLFLETRANCVSSRIWHVLIQMYQLQTCTLCILAVAVIPVIEEFRSLQDFFSLPVIVLMVNFCFYVVSSTQRFRRCTLTPQCRDFQNHVALFLFTWKGFGERGRERFPSVSWCVA